MNTDDLFSIVFWTLLASMLLTRDWFSPRVWRTGDRVLPDRAASGPHGRVAVLVIRTGPRARPAAELRSVIRQSRRKTAAAVENFGGGKGDAGEGDVENLLRAARGGRRPWNIPRVW